MPFCGKCGAAVNPGMSFCGSCGAPVVAAGSEGQPQAGGPAGYPPSGETPAAGPRPAAPASAPMASNVAGMLAYVAGFITGIVFLVIDPYKDDRFVRFHAFQS